MRPTFRGESFDFLPEDNVPDHDNDLPNSHLHDPECYALVGKELDGDTSYTLAINIKDSEVAHMLQKAHSRHLERVFAPKKPGWAVYIIPPLEPPTV